MALQYVGGTSGQGTSTGYTVSLSGTLTGGLASSPAEGDIVVVVSAFGNTASSSPNISGDSSGAYVAAHAALHANDTWDTEYRTFYQIMGSTPDATLTVTRVSNAAYGGATVVQVWRGVDTTNPLDVTPTTASGNNGSRPDPPAITPITSGAIIIAGGAGTQSTSGSAFTVFSGMSNGITVKSDGTTSDIGVLIASFEWTSGSYDPAAATGGTTSTSSSRAASTLALRPAPVAQTFFQTVSGSITGSSSLSDKLTLLRTYAASLTLSGALNAALVVGTTFYQALAGTIEMLGNPRRKTSTSTKAGSITMTATYTRRLIFGRLLGGSIALSGAILRAIRRSLGSSLTVSGAVSKKISRTLGSSLTLSGSILRKIGKTISGSFLMSSVVSYKTVITKAISGSLSSSGSVSNGPVIPNVPDETAPVLLSFLRRFIGRR